MQKNNTLSKRNSPHTFPMVLLLLALAVVVWSVINVQDTYLTWVLEAAPAIMWILVLILTYKHFRFPNWMYAVMCLHIIVLLVGAHYSYAEVPLGEWMNGGLASPETITTRSVILCRALPRH
ncbi:MAG: DUF2238 domain-containing protein [Bacteroidales bacterium]|nr:DUF2238 domain-containing protein [Bacteroidales bacterium]